MSPAYLVEKIDFLAKPDQPSAFPSCSLAVALALVWQLTLGCTAYLVGATPSRACTYLGNDLFSFQVANMSDTSECVS